MRKTHQNPCPAGVYFANVVQIFSGQQVSFFSHPHASLTKSSIMCLMLTLLETKSLLSLQGTDAAQVQSNSPLNLTASQHTFPPLTVARHFRWLEDLRSPTEVKQKQRKKPFTTHCPEGGPPQKGALYSQRSRPRKGTSSSPAANCSATAPRS